MVRNLLDTILYYTFHIIYLGYPADVLSRLWLTHDLAHRDTQTTTASSDSRTHVAWKTFDTSMRESYKAIGTLAGLLAATISGLSSIYGADETIRTLLLVGLTCSIISAASCLSLLSTVHIDPVNIEDHWKSSGIIFVLALSSPSAWLGITLWIFQATILAIVWLNESTPAKVLVTVLIGMRVVFKFAVEVHTIIPGQNPMLVELVLGLLGWRQGINHRMINLRPDTIMKRGEYLRRLSQDLNLTSGTEGQLPASVTLNLERANYFRGNLDAPQIQ